MPFALLLKQASLHRELQLSKRQYSLIRSAWRSLPNGERREVWDPFMRAIAERLPWGRCTDKEVTDAISAEDSGPGIDPQNIKRIFDRFFTTKAQGMGMGLAICRSIIEAHNGRLWAEAGVHQGSLFRISLPCNP
jgi:hypothetical protein